MLFAAVQPNCSRYLELKRKYVVSSTTFYSFVRFQTEAASLSSCPSFQCNTSFLIGSLLKGGLVSKWAVYFHLSSFVTFFQSCGFVMTQVFNGSLQAHICIFVVHFYHPVDTALLRKQQYPIKMQRTCCSNVF